MIVQTAVIDGTIVERLEEHWREYRPHEFRVDFDGYPIKIQPKVFNPASAYSTATMVEAMHIVPGDKVLDMGSGTGVLGILALLKGANSAVFVDKNPYAIANTKANLAYYGLDYWADVRHSDLFTAVPPQKFDVIFFNMPYVYTEKPLHMQVKSYSALFHSAVAPADSFCDVAYETTRRFFTQARDYLSPTGYIQCSFATIGNQVLLDEILRQNHWERKVRLSHYDPGHGHQYFVYEVRPA
jgi:release factor glutamine methyltransferase